MKKPTSIISKFIIYIGLGLTASQSMETQQYDKIRNEIPTDQYQKFIDHIKVLEIAEYSPIHDPISMRTRFNTILNNSADTAENRAIAQFSLAEMDWFGVGIPKANHTAARNGFNAVLNNYAAPPEIRECAQLRLYHARS